MTHTVESEFVYMNRPTMLKKDDTIRCYDQNDMKRTFKALIGEGYKAVVSDHDKNIIKITKVPE